MSSIIKEGIINIQNYKIKKLYYNKQLQLISAKDQSMNNKITAGHLG